MREFDLSDWDPEYLKCCGLPPIMDFEEAKRKVFWGTYGLPPTLPIRWVRLIDCSTEHLGNILKTQFQIYKELRELIEDILIERSRRK